MKIFRILFSVVTALFLTPLTQSIGAEYQLAVGTNEAVVVNLGIGVLTGLASNHLGQAAAFSGLNKEVWMPGLEDSFRWFGSWYERLRDLSSLMIGSDNEVVNLAKAAPDPDVLINPTYPLTPVSVADVASTADTESFVTQPTQIHDDELLFLAYDKKGETKTRHAKKLKRSIQRWTLHSIAPAAAVAGKKLVIVATGAAVSGTDTRKRLTFDDLDQGAMEMNELEWPKEGRVLVLCPKHQNDLKHENRNLYNLIFDRARSVPYGVYADFEIYEETHSISYTALNAKQVYGTAVSGTSRHGSVFFLDERAWRADSAVKAYSDEDTSNPLTHTAMFDLKMRHGSGALYEEGVGVFVSPAS